MVGVGRGGGVRHCIVPPARTIKIEASSRTRLKCARGVEVQIYTQPRTHRRRRRAPPPPPPTTTRPPPTAAPPVPALDAISERGGGPGRRRPNSLPRAAGSPGGASTRRRRGLRRLAVRREPAPPQPWRRLPAFVASAQPRSFFAISEAWQNARRSTFLLSMLSEHRAFNLEHLLVLGSTAATCAPQPPPSAAAGGGFAGRRRRSRAREEGAAEGAHDVEELWTAMMIRRLEASEL